MSRPKPDIILEKIYRSENRADHIIKSNGIWAVYYDGQPFNLKSQSTLYSYPGPKYKKIAFSNPGHAINLAKKLNKEFETNLFEVIFLSHGKTVFSQRTNN